MSPSLTLQLGALHPILLAKPDGSVIAERGIECGDGWYDVIDEMLIAIESHCVAVGFSPPAVT